MSGVTPGGAGRKETPAAACHSANAPATSSSSRSGSIDQASAISSKGASARQLIASSNAAASVARP
jgi:hypothetical protein